MADPVALISVISSGSVAVASVVFQATSGRAQRKHERTLAFEGRAWEKKSETLFEVIAACRHLLDSLDGPGKGHDLPVVVVTEVGWRLDKVMPEVEAFSSTACRVECANLRRLLVENSADGVEVITLRGLRDEKIAQIDARDFERAARLRQQELELLDQMTTDYSPDGAAILAQAKKVIGQARQSVRGQE